MTRTWTDANGNFVPDCDLLNPAAQDLRRPAATSAARCRTCSFGQNVLTNNYDPALLNGWGVRPSDWNLGVSMQQQMLPRASVEVALQPPLVPRLHGDRQPRWRPTATTRRTASPRRPTRGCRAAAATSSPASTTSPRRKFGQINNLVTDSTDLRRRVSVLQRRRRHAQRADARRA